LREKSILIVTPDRKVQRTVARILGVTGYPIDIADALEQGMRLMEHRAPLLVVVDGTATVSPAADAFFAMAQARGAEACMTLLADDAADHMPRILGLGAITNLLVHPMPFLAEELTTTVHKLVHGDLFGAEKYLLWGTELHAQTLTNANQRAEFAAQLADDVRARGQSARVASMAMLVADELMSNAVQPCTMHRSMSVASTCAATWPARSTYRSTDAMPFSCAGVATRGTSRSKSRTSSAASIARRSCAR
jgi:DNA-binding response OmpR family regulator